MKLLLYSLYTAHGYNKLDLAQERHSLNFSCREHRQNGALSFLFVEVLIWPVRVFYLIFAEGNVQEWARSKQISNENDKKVSQLNDKTINSKKKLFELEGRNSQNGIDQQGMQE